MRFLSLCRMTLALIPFLIACGLLIASIYIGGNKFADLFVKSLKRRVGEL